MKNIFDFFFGSISNVIIKEVDVEDVKEIIEEISAIGEFVSDSMESEDLSLLDRLKISEEICNQALESLKILNRESD
jgi:hypothetical protein